MSKEEFGTDWVGKVNYCQQWGMDTYKDTYVKGPLVAAAVPIVANGRLTGYTKHGINQAIGRNGGVGVSSKSILDTVKNPVNVVLQSGGRIKYIGTTSTVITNGNGKVITAWANGSTGLRGGM